MERMHGCTGSSQLTEAGTHLVVNQFVSAVHILAAHIISTILASSQVFRTMYNNDFDPPAYNSCHGCLKSVRGLLNIQAVFQCRVC